MPDLPPPRGCTPEDLPRVLAAANRAFLPGGGDMGARYPLLFDARHCSRLRVCEYGGEILSHAGFWLGDITLPNRTFRAACFGAVFTTAEWRGAGAATAVLADAVACARSAGAEVGFISGSRSLYGRLGFDRLPPVPVYRITAATACAGPVAVQRASVSDLNALATLYAAQPSRFVRSSDDWARLLSSRFLFVGPATLWTVRRGGGVCGYFAVNDEARTSATLGSVFRALEVVGDQVALADAAPVLLQLLGGAALELVHPDDNGDFSALARVRKWQVDATRFAFGAAIWNQDALAQPLPWYGLNFV